MGTGLEISFILLLIVANGLFAMSEIALVSSRRARLQKLAEKGDTGAAGALVISAASNQFLSTVQVGITLIGTLAGAFGGATIAAELVEPLSNIPWIGANANVVAFAIVVGAITYLSLILGELVPKRIALNGPEAIAAVVARPMQMLSRVASPAVKFLSFSTEAVLKLLPFRQAAEPAVTEDEIRGMIEMGTDSGVFHREEREFVEGVFRLGDRRAVEVMTPRSRMVWIDVLQPEEEAVRVIREHSFSRFPAARGSLDHVVGFVETRDFITPGAVVASLASRVKKLLFVPETLPALRLIERFRASRSPMALVVDEHGQVMGMITPIDLLEAIVGDLPVPEESLEPRVVRREDGSMLVDGLTTIDELKELLRLESAGEAEENYNTVGGFVMHEIRQVPQTGDHFMYAGYRFEVVDMDGRRVDRVLITPPAAASSDAD